MSNFAIESWISSTAGAGPEYDEEAGGASWSRNLVPRDWSKALDYARNVLLVGKTKARIQFLRDELLSLAKHGGMPTLAIWTMSCTRIMQHCRSDSVADVGCVQAAYIDLSSV